jgi:formyl-CoA transferase
MASDAPLADVTVLELTQMVAGAHAGMVLGDLGADVVKVERPGVGDIARNVPPEVGDTSFYYASVNRGKRSVTLDLKRAAGREAFLSLAERADVVLENLSPGTVEDLGVGYEAVRERNPAVVYCSVSAYGQTGPKRDSAGIDTMIQAYAGVPSMTRDRDGRPLRVGLPVADLAGAMYAAVSVLGALRRRDRTGRGDYLDVALGDSLLSFLSVRAGYSFTTGEPFPSIARSHVYFAPEGIFTTADGYVQVSTVTEAHWERLCRALEHEDLLERPTFEIIADRCENRDELNDLLDEVFASESTDHWLAVLADHDVPAVRIRDTGTLWDDPHVEARESTADVRTPSGDRFRMLAHPTQYDDWEWAVDEYIASLGADTEAELRTAGYSTAEIAELAADDVI